MLWITTEISILPTDRIALLHAKDLSAAQIRQLPCAEDPFRRMLLESGKDAAKDPEGHRKAKSPKSLRSKQEKVFRCSISWSA